MCLGARGWSVAPALALDRRGSCRGVGRVAGKLVHPRGKLAGVWRRGGRVAGKLVHPRGKLAGVWRGGWVAGLEI